MIKTPFESQDQVLYSTLPTLNPISTPSSATSHPVKNSQTLQRFWSPLYPPAITHVLFTMDIVFSASLIQCLLIPTQFSDCLPPMTPIASALFVSDPRPHNLIIVFPTCTLRVCLLPDLFLVRFTIRVPSELKPPPDLRRILPRF